MFNYFNFKRFHDKYLITNDFGRYMFVEPDQFKALILNDADCVNNSEFLERLEKNLFVYDSDERSFAEKTPFDMFQSKNHLFRSTQLHIFVVTTKCNHQCVYCQAQNGVTVPNGFMSKEVARKAVDIALQSPADVLDFEFQGGEPLMNFDTIRFIVEYAEQNSDKEIKFSIVSNLSLLTDEIIEYVKEHNISISTSLDGKRDVHDVNRPFRNGNGSFDMAVKQIKRLQNACIDVGAIETTTKHSLGHAKDIVDIYNELGLHNIFIRPLTPLGTASKNWDDIGYTAEEFLSFYKGALDCIIEKDLNGSCIVENHARIFLTKIMCGFAQNYMELRSPCGATIGQIAYYFDGNIFTCDEGRMLFEMGDDSFCVGNVNTSNYQSIIDTKVCKLVAQSSILESAPSCSDCVYQPYCGTCPVVNYAIHKTVHEVEPNEYKCRIYAGMLDILFDYLYKNDEQIEEVFRRWLN